MRHFAPSTKQNIKAKEANQTVKLWEQNCYLVKKFVCKLHPPYFNERAYVKTYRNIISQMIMFSKCSKYYVR